MAQKRDLSQFNFILKHLFRFENERVDSKGCEILLYIIVLIVSGCFDRTYGLNKLFLHSMHALCFC